MSRKPRRSCISRPGRLSPRLQIHTQAFGDVRGDIPPLPFRSSPERVSAEVQPDKGLKKTMALPDFSMRQLLEAGAHFGHQTHRWNPKMEKFIFGSRSNIHIIDLSQSIPLLHQALVKVREVAASGGRVLF